MQQVLPRFPEFKKIEISDREIIESYTSKFPQYSDFGFTSLWAWDTNSSRQISDLRGNLAVQFSDYHTEEPFLSFLGDNDATHTALDLITFAESMKISPVLRLVPEISALLINRSDLEVEEDRDSFEYLLSVPEIAEYSGAKFESKRKMLKRFMRENSGAVVEFADLADTNVQASIRSVIRRWEHSKKSSNKEYFLEHEETSLERLLQTASSHSLLVGGVFIGGEMQAFTIDEIVGQGICLGQYWKADLMYKGIYEFLANRVAVHLQAQGIAVWNWEQDLGNLGLRKSKLSYEPCAFLKKYTVRIRS